MDVHRIFLILDLIATEGTLLNILDLFLLFDLCGVVSLKMSIKLEITEI